MRSGGVFKFFYARNIISQYSLMEKPKQKLFSPSSGKEGARESKKPLSALPRQERRSSESEQIPKNCHDQSHFFLK